MIRWMGIGLCIMILGSCQQSNNLNQSDIIGAWEIIGAVRNGQETETLNGAFFEFTRDSQMTTNIMGREETSNYTCENGVIQQSSHDGEPLLVIHAKLENRDLIEFQTEIQNIEFTLKLRKIIE